MSCIDLIGYNGSTLKSIVLNCFKFIDVIDLLTMVMLKKKGGIKSNSVIEFFSTNKNNYICKIVKFFQKISF